MSVLLVAAPDLLDPKSATHNTKPRLSFSTKPIVLNSSDDCDTLVSVMKWKTVSAIFLLVVLYLIIGATVFRALEKPYESSQKYAILKEKLEFLARHSCVNSSELEDLVKVCGFLQACFLWFCWGSVLSFKFNQVSSFTATAYRNLPFKWFLLETNWSH